MQYRGRRSQHSCDEENDSGFPPTPISPIPRRHVKEPQMAYLDVSPKSANDRGEPTFERYNSDESTDESRDARKARKKLKKEAKRAKKQ